MTTAATPIVKWVGGKTKLLPELLRRMPVIADGSYYFEPFAGGLALYFAAAPKLAVLADLNPHLINMYTAVRDDVESVIRGLRNLQRRHRASPAETYYRERDRWNDSAMQAWVRARAARFIYLNKTCFNGLWRENASGEFNVPIGTYEKPKILDPQKLRAASKALFRATIDHGPYQEIAKRANAGDFVYFDPPYDPHSETANFTGYTANGFGQTGQAHLAFFARNLVDGGVRVMLSNNDTPYIRKLYRDKGVFKIHRVKAPRSINSDGAKRGEVNEVIITGGYKP